MAGSTVKKRSRRTSSRTGKPLVSRGRKKEVLGLILMVVAVLMSLAIATYSQADDALARAFTIENALNPGENRADNALGLVGAALAHSLVPGLIGYTSLLLTGLLFAWGYVFIRHKSPKQLALISILVGVGALALACFFGWIAVAFESDLLLWSGHIGLGSAVWMQHVFGTAGSVVILLLVLTVISLLIVDHDIQRSLDRVEAWIMAARTSLGHWTAGAGSWLRDLITDRERPPGDGSAVAVSQKTRAAEARESGDGWSPMSEAPALRGKDSPVESGQERIINDLFVSSSRPSSTKRSSSPETAHDHDDLELQVRKPIEEERADSVQRAADVPDADRRLHYRFPNIDILDERDASAARIDYSELEENKRILLEKLDTYNIEITGINAIVGPTVTLYELTPAPGVKISRITALEDDLAMAMAARGIRMIAPIPGKSAIGVEIPNRHRELVPIRDVIGTARFRDSKMELPIPIGKTIEGEVYMQDLTKLPHLLIAGATGSGKSVGLNALIAGLLYACHPANLKFVMIDPKKIELQQYAHISEHYIAMPESGTDPIITDFSEALGVLKSCEREMEFRYDLLSEASVRGIKEYNRKLQEGQIRSDAGFKHLPYIVVIVDELADLMMTAGKEIEGPIARLAQMARAVGIHLVLATQRPSVDVITGLIKANFPARIAYQVASKIDSRTILDQNGAEGLVGNGDLLYMMGSQVIRLQGPFVSVAEVDRIVDFIADQRGAGPYLLPPADEPHEAGDFTGVEDIDDLFEEAARIIVRSQQGSVSLLQCKLSVGYTRAARIVDQLEEAGIVGPFVGSKAREVLVESELHLDELFKSRDASKTPD